MREEYNATNANAYNCYATLHAYSVGGKFSNPIINPTPSTVVPMIFQNIKPNTPSHLSQRTHFENTKPTYAYSTINKYCQ